MSEILSNIVVQPTNINVTPTTNNINVVPEAIMLNVYTGGGGGAGTSNNGQLLYNNVNLINGVPNTSVSGGNLSFTNLANLKISGGNNAFYLQTDGTGNLTWAPGTANVTGNGTASGANTLIQISNGSGGFTSGAGFSFDKASNLLTVPGNVVATGNVTGNYILGNGIFLTGLSTTAITNGNSNVTIATAGGNVTFGVNGAANVLAVSNTNVTVGGVLVALSSANIVGNTTVSNISGNSANFTTFSGNGNVNNFTVNGTTSIYEGIENVAIIGAQTGTYNFNLLDGSIQYSTANATANLVLNFRGNSTTTTNSVLSAGKSITSTYIMTTGSNSAVGITGIQIDGSNTAIAWAGNITPTFFTQTTQTYTFTIVKIDNTPTYKVLGSSTRYG